MGASGALNSIFAFEIMSSLLSVIMVGLEVLACSRDGSFYFVVLFRSRGSRVGGGTWKGGGVEGDRWLDGKNSREKESGEWK